MKSDFPLSSNNFFRRMMQQTKDLLNDHLVTLDGKNGQKFQIQRWRSPKKNEKEDTTI
jgi:hypothetical protein